MKSQLEDLYRRTGITKESCFYASRRMGRHDALSLWALTTLAFSLVIISMITQVYADNYFVKEYSRFIGVSTTSMSVFALVISILVQKSSFSLRSEKYRKQAMEISDLRISFRHLIDNNPADGKTKEEIYNEKSKSYADTLNRNLVHDQIDYLITNSKGIENKYYNAKLFITEYLGYWVIIIITLFLLAWVCIGTYGASLTVL